MHLPRKSLALVLSLLLLGISTRYSSAQDDPQIVVGERLFLETRFAQFFQKNSKEVNTPLVNGDPVLDSTQTTSGSFEGKFKGFSMNCRACHLVDEHKDDKMGGMRTYADFARRSPIPLREDGKTKTLRNSPPQVNISIRREFTFFHFDGQFGGMGDTATSTAMEDLVKTTLTGRNFGWMPHEERAAYAHIAKVIREDNGTFPFPDKKDFGGRYDRLLKGEDPDPKLKLPPEFQIDVQKANDVEIVDAVAKLIAVYVNDLKFSQDKSGNYNSSPYDIFLRKNQLPTGPNKDEAAIDYSRRLLKLLEKGSDWKYVTTKDHEPFKFHKQDFVFGELELSGLKTFLQEPSGVSRKSKTGNCIACHAAPHFSDFTFHNTGASQEEYDSVHGAGEFAKIVIPDQHTRQKNYRAYLPVQPGHFAIGSGPFADIPAKEKPGHVDLGMWNVFQNPTFPRPQDALTKLLQKQFPDITDPKELLAKTVATFKTPGLRDLGHSAPYLHSGRMDSLEAVVRFYQVSSSLARDGKVRNAAKDLNRIYLVDDDVLGVAAFLKSLNEDYE